MATAELLAAPEGSATFEWDLLDHVERYSAAAIGLVRAGDRLAPLDREAWMGHVHPADRDRVAAAIDAAIASEDGWSLSYRLLPASRAEIRVSERGFVVRDGGRALRVLGVIEREDASDATGSAWESGRERLYAAIVNFIPQLCWAADASGWVDLYNDRWYEYTGTTPAQMEGWGWISVHDPLDLPRMLRIWRNALATGEPWQDEFRLRRGSDGALRWHLSRAMPLRDEQGRIVRWFGTNTDVHDQKLAAEEYARLLVREQHLRREADAASRAKDEFLAVVSHELRTPLSVILNGAALLRQRSLPPGKHDEIVARIERNARLQTKLVSDLLDVSRIVAGKLTIDAEPVDLSRVAEAALEGMRESAREKGVLLSCAPGPSGAWVRGDAARLQQCLANLIDNAVKFTPAGKRVHVEVRVLAERVEVAVRDEGGGLAPDQIPRLFRRFSQVDSTSTRRQGGLGLGLAIVRELLERQGGEAVAESAGPGRGSTFTVRMPRLSASQQAAEPAAPVAGEPVSLAGLRVLVVDDEPDVRSTLSEMLLQCGATVSAVGSAREALHAFRLGAPDALVCDVAMPEVDGYELIRRVRALPGAAARTPALALTAYASTEHRERALAAGFDAYLAKPAEAPTLSRTLAELCRDRLLTVS